MRRTSLRQFHSWKGSKGHSGKQDTNYVLQVMPTNWNSIWHMTYLVWQSIMAYYLTYILTFYLTYILTFYLAFDLTYILTFYLAFDMRYILTFYQAFYHIFFVTSCTRNWGPAVPVEIWLLQLRSGSTPLSSGPRGWGPAVLTEIGRSQLRSGSAHWRLALTVEVGQCALRDWHLVLAVEVPQCS